MHILCSTDQNYIMPTGVMMKSVSINNKDEVIRFHIIIDDSVSEQQKAQLEKVVEANNKHSVIFYIFDSSLLNTFPHIGEVKREYMTKVTYYRLLVDKILPKEIDKIIYLDSDIIVDKSLAPLWQLDLSDKAIACVTDMSEKLHDYGRLGYDSNLGYFNAGVLVMNLSYWRKHHITEQFLDIIYNYPERIRLHDQDILNIVFSQSKINLPFGYNLQNGFLYKPEYLEIDREKYSRDLEQAFKDYIIIHYTDVIKPWHLECCHPLKKKWIEYRNLTIWKKCKIKRKRSIPLKTKFGNLLREYHIMTPFPQKYISSKA